VSFETGWRARKVIFDLKMAEFYNTELRGLMAAMNNPGANAEDSQHLYTMIDKLILGVIPPKISGVQK